MIKVSVGIAYEQNRPTGVASVLRAQFDFWEKSALKMHCTAIFLRQKLLQITISNFWCKDHGCGLCPDVTIRFFGKKCLKNVLYKSFFKQKLLQTKICNFYIMYYFSISRTIMEL